MARSFMIPSMATCATRRRHPCASRRCPAAFGHRASVAAGVGGSAPGLATTISPKSRRRLDEPHRALGATGGLDDPALLAIAEIVHDIVLKDDKFGREECACVKTLVAGITMAHSDDEAWIAAGSVILDN